MNLGNRTDKLKLKLKVYRCSTNKIKKMAEKKPIYYSKNFKLSY